MRIPSLPEPLHELRRSPAAIPALIMVGVFVFLGAAEGGYFPAVFLPAALFALALLATTLVSLSTSTAVPRAVAVAAALLAGYAAWSYASILWAGDQGAAWEAANRSLMYAIVFALFALWRLRDRAATVIVGALGLGIAGLGLVTLIRAAAASDVSGMFVYGRFAEPVGYINGNVALWTSGLLPCLFLAARRELWPPIRGLALGGAGLLASLAVLGQSRGWLLVTPIALIAFLAVAPGRARNGAALLAVLAAVLLALDPLLDVFEGFNDGLELEPLTRSAAQHIFLVSGLLALVGMVVALAERRVRLPGPAVRSTRIAAGIGLVVAGVAAAAVVTASFGNPVVKAADAWQEFQTGSDAADQPAGSSRFVSLSGQNRYDFWRVAFAEFTERPLTGAGAGNFQTSYLREGETDERPRFPHSLEARLLSETGVVGTLLFTGGVVAALLAAARAIRLRAGLGAAVAGTAVATFVYWALHGSVDWLYEIPALGAPAFAMLALAAGLAPRTRPAAGRFRDGALAGGPRRLAALMAVTAAAAFALGAPWLGQLHIDAAVESWERDPSGAFDRLETAADLNPVSIAPHAAAGAIALRLDRVGTAREEFEAVLEHDPDDAYATLQLGAIASQLGQREEASRLLRRAAELSPRDGVIRDALRSVRAGDALEAEVVYEDVLRRQSELTGGEPPER